MFPASPTLSVGHTTPRRKTGYGERSPSLGPLGPGGGNRQKYHARAMHSSVVGSPSSSMLRQESRGRDLLADAQQGALAAAHAISQGQISPGDAVPPAPPEMPVSHIEKFTTEAVEFNLYTDPELESHRELVPLPRNDRNRLCRQTISAMRVKTHRLRHSREPERSEIMQMAQALCMRYKGLREGNDPSNCWVSLLIIISSFLELISQVLGRELGGC